MKSKLLSVIVLLIIVVTSAPAVMAGEKIVGLTTGYNTRNECAVAGVFFRYRINRLFRISPDIIYMFRNNDVDGLSINCNLNMPLNVIPKLDFYPLAGLSYTSWNYHPHEVVAREIMNSDDVTTRTNKLGINVGAGLDIKVTNTLRLFVEGKYTGVRKYSSGTITAGIGYCF